MPITFVAAGAPYQGAATGLTTIDVPYPAGVQVDDLLLLHVTLSATQPLTAPSGWTALEPNLPMGVGGPAAQTFYRFADASDGSASAVTVTGPSAKYEAHIIALRGVSTTTLRDAVTPVGGQSATATMAVPPDITTTTDGAWVLLFASALSLANAANSVWSSGNMTVRNQGTGTIPTGQSNPTGAIATVALATPGTFTPTIDITPGPGRSSMRVVALRAASSVKGGAATGTWRFTGTAVGDAPGAGPTTIPIVFVGAGTPLQPTEAALTSITVPHPPAVQVGDLLLLHIVTSTGAAPAAQDGWTALEPNLAMGAAGPSAVTFYKVAADTTATATTWTVASAKYEAHTIALRNVDPTTMRDVTSPAGTQSATATMAVPPDVTTATAGAWVLLFASALALSGAPGSVWSSSNMTIRNQGTAASTTANPTGAIASAMVTPAGLFTPTIDITPGPGRSSMRVVAFRPASTLRAGGAAGTWSFAGVAAGVTPRAVSAWSAAVSDTTPAGGTATPGTWSFTGAATGKRPTNRGTAAGSFTFAGATTGKRPARGAAAGLFSFTSSAAGIHIIGGYAYQVWEFVGVAVGRTTRRGAAIGGWAFTGTATGRNQQQAQLVEPITATWDTDGASAATWATDGTGTATFTGDGISTAAFTSDGIGEASFA